MTLFALGIIAGLLVGILYTLREGLKEARHQSREIERGTAYLRQLANNTQSLDCHR